jgi:head-tail adaptor
VGPHTRIAWEDRVLDVVGAPVEIGRRQRLSLACVERGL